MPAQLPAHVHLPVHLPLSRAAAPPSRPHSPHTAHNCRLLAAQQQKRAVRKRHRGHLTGLVSAALLVAFLTGTTSYRMHLAMRSEQQLDADTADLAHDAWAAQGASDSGALAGLRSWLAGGRGRRNLREGLAASGAGTDRGRAAALQGSDRDAGALGVQLYNHWWMLGGC